MSKKRKGKPREYRWSGTFSNRPRASQVTGPLWLAADGGAIHVVNVEERSCGCSPGVRDPKCRHIAIALAQRRHLIHSGYATRNKRAIAIPDTDRLLIAQIARSFRRSLRSMGVNRNG